jgi:hypothetical protein
LAITGSTTRMSASLMRELHQSTQAGGDMVVPPPV